MLLVSPRVFTCSLLETSTPPTIGIGISHYWYSLGFSRVSFKADIHTHHMTSLAPIVWIWLNIKHEMAHFVHIRQQYLVSPSHSSTAQARTVMVTGIPQEFLTESALTRLFSHLPGGVRKVWINRDLGDMPKLYNQRLKACQMLEFAATSLLIKAIKTNRKRLRNSGDGGLIFSDTKLRLRSDTIIRHSCSILLPK
jgi:hypothetical protein